MGWRSSTVLGLALGIAAHAQSSGWGSFSAAFPTTPCQDGWAGCVAYGQHVDAELRRDGAGRAIPADARIGWFDLQATASFSPFTALSAYEIGGTDVAVADVGEPEPAIEEPPPVEPEPEPERQRDAVAVADPDPPRVPSPPPAPSRDREAELAAQRQREADAAAARQREQQAERERQAALAAQRQKEIDAQRQKELAAQREAAAAATERERQAALERERLAKLETERLAREKAAAEAEKLAEQRRREEEAARLKKEEEDRKAREAAALQAGGCTDTTKLEPYAAMGKLSEELKTCLDSRTKNDVKMTDRRKASQLLMADAWARSDRKGWETLVKYHLDEIDQSDPDLCYKYALYLSQQGPSRASGVVRWANVALENRMVWIGEEYTNRVFSLYKLRAAASQSLWQEAEEKHRTAGTDETRDDVEKKRNMTKVNAREWYEFAKESGKDASVALQLCMSAAGTADYCEAG